MIVSAFVLMPLAIAVLLLATPGRASLHRALSLASGAALLGLALWMLSETLAGRIFVVALGGWEPRIGIVWVSDGLGSLMLFLSSLLSLSTLWYAPPSLEESERDYFYPLHQLLMTGVYGCFVTADLFNLFVFFEVMLLTSFVQISLGGDRQSLRKTFPYILLNLVGSMIFLVGVGFVYATTGTVNLAHLAELTQQNAVSPLFWAGFALVMGVFALKTALAPFYFWLPDSYPAAPVPIAALFAGLLTKVGVYTLYRSLLLLAGDKSEIIQTVLLPVCIVTMIVGVAGALGRKGFREILSFHIVSQVGYMVLSLTFWTRAGIAAGVFYIAHHMIVKTALFYCAGAAEYLQKKGEARGLALSHPYLAAGFFLPAMALAGMPPLSGFWAKLFVLQAGVEIGAWFSVVAIVTVSFFTLASMLKIWNQTFWGEPVPQSAHLDRRLLGPVIALAGISVVMGLCAAPVYSRLEPIADQLLNSKLYIEAVLGRTQATGGVR